MGCGLWYGGLVSVWEVGNLLIGGILLSHIAARRVRLRMGGVSATIDGGVWRLLVALGVTVTINALPVCVGLISALTYRMDWFGPHRYVNLGIAAVGGVAGICSVPLARASGLQTRTIRFGAWSYLVFSAFCLVNLGVLILLDRSRGCGWF